MKKRVFTTKRTKRPKFGKEGYFFSFSFLRDLCVLRGENEFQNMTSHHLATKHTKLGKERFIFSPSFATFAPSW
jgi:hypothetical protein